MCTFVRGDTVVIVVIFLTASSQRAPFPQSTAPRKNQDEAQPFCNHRNCSPLLGRDVVPDEHSGFGRRAHAVGQDPSDEPFAVLPARPSSWSLRLTLTVSMDTLYFSFANMVLYNSSGWKDVVITLAGSDVLDAGTEVNDELPENVAFLEQSSPNTGVDENGVVEIHPGFSALGMV